MCHAGVMTLSSSFVDQILGKQNFNLTISKTTKKIFIEKIK